MAAAYAYHIAGNHPFLDGNKRAGLEAAILFLDLNGITVHASREAIIDAGMSLAQGRLTIAQLADFFRAKSRR